MTQEPSRVITAYRYNQSQIPKIGQDYAIEILNSPKHRRVPLIYFAYNEDSVALAYESFQSTMHHLVPRSIEALRSIYNTGYNGHLILTRNPLSILEPKKQLHISSETYPVLKDFLEHIAVSQNEIHLYMAQSGFENIDSLFYVASSRPPKNGHKKIKPKKKVKIQIYE